MGARLSIGAARIPLWSLAVLGAVVSVAAIAWLPNAIVWVAAVWLAVCVAGVVTPGSKTRRLLCVNLAFFLLVFGAIELYWSFDPVVRSEGSALGDYIDSHDVLGYAPRKGHETTLRRYADDEIVYDVTYTIDDRGLRIAPPVAASDVPCALFFGGSFMFGEGLENEETLAYQVGARSGGRLRVHNFGFHGYGPHQMLAALQQGLVEEAIDCAPRQVVYQSAPFHVARAAGLSSWESGGPRFEVKGDGRAEYRGKWDEDRHELPDWLVRAGSVSRLIGKLSTVHRPVDEGDRARYLAILETTRDEIAARYPNAVLRVVYWDDPGDRLADELESRGFRVDRVNEILPDRAEDPARYRLHPLDGHPNALAMSRIATHLVESMDAPDADTR